MECTFYQFKRKIQCEECTKEGQLDPEETINRLVGDFPGQRNRQNSANNAFRSWCNEYPSGSTLMFKYPPPKKNDILNKAYYIRDNPNDDKDSLKEFSPEYSLQKVRPPTFKQKGLLSNGSCDDSLSTHDSSEASIKRLCSPKNRTLLRQQETLNKTNESSHECYSVPVSSSQDMSSTKPSLLKDISKSSKIQRELGETRDCSLSPRKSKDSSDSLSINFNVSDNQLDNVQHEKTSCDPKTLVPRKNTESSPLKQDNENVTVSCCSESLMQCNCQEVRDTTQSKDINSGDSKKCSSKNNSKEENTDGKWCTSVPGCTKRTRNSSPLKRLNTREIAEMKKKYNLSNFHRGKWLINEGCCLSVKMSTIWREICKMLKCGQLPYCTAKYEKTNQEIWIYCDVIYSLEVRKKLKSNCKLKVTTPLTYWVHPHGSVLKV